jgi:nitrogen fixation NifU-like protein
LIVSLAQYGFIRSAAFPGFKRAAASGSLDVLQQSCQRPVKRKCNNYQYIVLHILFKSKKKVTISVSFLPKNVKIILQSSMLAKGRPPVQPPAPEAGRDPSKTYLEMASRCDRRQSMEKPDGYGKRSGACGDTVEIFLRIEDGRIQKVCFLTDGCLNTHACANALSTLAEGCAVEQAWNIAPEDVSDYLETLPETHFHCAELAVGAFYLALVDYREIARSPWKKAYR